MLTSGCTYSQMVNSSKVVRVMVKVGTQSGCTYSQMVNFSKDVKVMVKVG